jgi:peptide/nickel transport system substrate-binding protein
MFAGYLLNPALPFSAFKEPEIGAKVQKLFVTPNHEERVKGYRELLVETANKGGPIPLLQAVGSVAYKDNLNYAKYDNFWILPQHMSWK